MTGEDDGTERRTVTRRNVVVGGAGAVVGGVAGVATFSGGILGKSTGPRSVSKRAPDDDGEATLGELRWLLENHPESEYTIDVTAFEFDDGVIDVRYESGAKTKSGTDRWKCHLNELGHVIDSFATYVASDGPNLEWSNRGGRTTNGSEDGDSASNDAPTTVPPVTIDEDASMAGERLIAHVENPYTVEDGSKTPAQDEAYGIERRWIVNWIVGAWSTQRILNTVRQTRIGTTAD